MACMGPSKEFSVIKSQEAFDKIMQMMKEEYQVARPDAILGIVVEKIWQDDWDIEEARLRDALTNMFWTSDAANF